MCRWLDAWYISFFCVMRLLSLSLCTCMYYEQYMPLDFGFKVAHQHEGESQRGPSTLHDWCWVPFAQGRAVGDWFTHFMHLKYHPTQDNSYSNTSSKLAVNWQWVINRFRSKTNQYWVLHDVNWLPKKDALVCYPSIGTIGHVELHV